MSKYIIADKKFNTKKQSYEYCKMLITTLGRGRIEPGHISYPYFVALINNHARASEKIGAGIKYFIIRKTIYGKSYEVNIRRVDNTTISFSWVKCAKFNSKPKERQNVALTHAMRNNIKPQISNFRSTAELVCVFCKDIDSEMHVDHKDTNFCKLRDDFLKNNKPPAEFDKHPETHSEIFKVQDSEFANKWAEYHAKHTTLQILCRSCNLEKR
jgi:hypothetical protein